MNEETLQIVQNLIDHNVKTSFNDLLAVCENSEEVRKLIRFLLTNRAIERDGEGNYISTKGRIRK